MSPWFLLHTYSDSHESCALGRIYVGRKGDQTFFTLSAHFYLPPEDGGDGFQFFRE